MPWDINSLRLLHFRFDKTLAPVHLFDRTMNNILTIPPITKVKVSDVSTTQHIYGTRLNVERPQELPVEKPSTVSNEREISLALDQANNETLLFLGPSFDVSLFIWEQILYFGFGPQEIAILRNSSRDLTDQIINLDLWHHAGSQPYIELTIRGSRFGHTAVSGAYLRVHFLDRSRSLVSTSQHGDCESYILAYNENSHWSLVGLTVERKRCYLANFVHGFHGNVRRSVQKLVGAWEALTQDSVRDNMLILSCKVSKQDDAHSCGWRVLANAELLLERIYDEQRKSARNLADCLNLHVEVFRMTMIHNMINLVETRPLRAPKVFVPPQPRPQPRPPPRRAAHTVLENGVPEVQREENLFEHSSQYSWYGRDNCWDMLYPEMRLKWLLTRLHAFSKQGHQIMYQN
ncbi:hypothetical protein L7F22_053756 [Adiantum nelumboides]|nr:hypothetical protein [Adiantum nelumboides]